MRAPVACVVGVVLALACAVRAPGAGPEDVRARIERFNAVYSDATSGDADRREVLTALRAALVETPPAALSEREDMLLAQRRENNDLPKQTLLGHFVIVLATDRFASRAKENGFVTVMDLAYVALKHFWGNDPIARCGNRFIIWADANMGGGHRCQGLALQIAVGRADADNADWFEAFFHEMTHGFQYAHPANCYSEAGIFEGFAEFCKAVVCEYLAPLGPPFEGRFAFYSRHFPQSAGVEYLPTRLPVEEIIAYDPSSGLLMELANLSLDARGRPDWTAMRGFVQGPLKRARWVPWHLWPRLTALDGMKAFGAERSRPIFAKYRFPLDEATLREVERVVGTGPRACDAARTAVREWRVLGPVANPKGMGIEWNPLDVENLAMFPAMEQSVLSRPEAEGLAWRTDVRCDENGYLHLRDDSAKGSEFHYVVGALPEGARGLVTLYVSSDDDAAVYLDGRLVHLFRGGRGCTPDFPDVVYARNDGPGRVVAVVVNHGGPGAFSLAWSAGTPIERGHAERLKSADAAERAAEAEYLGSRRFVAPLTTPLLVGALGDADAGVRRAAARVLGGVRNDVGVVDALVARAAKEGDGATRDALLGAIGELTFRRPMPETVERTWAEMRERYAASFAVEAELAWRLGTINAGFFGNNAGAYGGQCVDRGWGGDPSHFLSLPVEARGEGVRTLRFRYAHPAETGKFTLRLRRGTTIVADFPVTLARTKTWTEWKWHEVKTPALAAGRYYVEMIGPRCTPVIDVVSLEPR